MRTTVELRDDQRSALMALAALRGMKGFSGVLEEAIDVYLERNKEKEERVRTLAKLAGSISAEDAELLRRRTEEVRQSWR
ncbi:MAG TPA: hypothetical protein VG944_18490 [Fimbriimonas sp.]|nr:hypothetical protein [Fimbriimonas sp.]